jgi:hypothetical protein
MLANLAVRLDGYVEKVLFSCPAVRTQTFPSLQRGGVVEAADFLKFEALTH